MSDELRDQTSKRINLNLLIQGCAVQAFFTAHHLVRVELERIQPDLTLLYDRVAIATILNMWYGEPVVLLGHPARFWRRTSVPDHPFRDYPVLARHGGLLAEGTRRHLVGRAKVKSVSCLPVLNSIQVTRLLFNIRGLEDDHRETLVELAKRTTTMIWDIEEERLDGRLTTDVAFGHLHASRTWTSKLLRLCAAGYGGVRREANGFRVVARAWIWPLLVHELVKGTAELVCLHGLNTLDRETYDAVTFEADRIEHEPWLMQSGSELWRRLLPLLPDVRPASECLMHIARAEPADVERLLLAVIEDPSQAREMLAAL